MTALPTRRRRRTMLVGVVALVLVVSAGVLFAVGLVTLSNSEEGEAIGVDDRPVVQLPDTSNALLAVTDFDGSLASLVVLTLLPDGVGGSIVTVPVNADVDAGFTDSPERVDERFASIDPDDAEQLDDFRNTVGDMLSISIDQVGVVDPSGTRELLGGFAEFAVDLPIEVLDTEGIGPDVLAEPGIATLTRVEAVQILTAIDETLASIDQHALDVAVWSGIGAAMPIAGDVPDVDDPPDDDLPDDVAELFERLAAGEVSVRDLAVVVTPAAAAGDVVVVDRRDALLVFGQVSPTRVLTPNAGLTFRVDSDITDEQLAASGASFESMPELMRNLIGELLFFQSNPVSIDTTPTVEGAPRQSRVEVADEQFLDDVAELASLVFGDSEVVLADEVIEGIDVSVELGTGYLAFRAAIDAGETPDPTVTQDESDS